MKVSLNWIREFTKVGLPVDELVEKIGSQLGAVEEVVDIGKKYQGVVVAKVISCEKHPNADKLHVCKIDDGGKAQNVERDSDGLVQVVCGAPNVRESLLVAWLPPGVTMPSSLENDPFVLETRELRGIKSNGMLASAHELAISDDHAGILEIDKAAKPGDHFATVYKLDDTIIDIENKMFTHRPDCFGALGVAREIAGIQQKPFKSPEWYKEDPAFPEAKVEELKLQVKNDLPKLVPRFTAITMSDVKVGSSPVWLQVALAKVGQKSINNIVDLTNFYMLVTGQPLHAYDYDKVKAFSAATPTIVIRHPKKGEKIKLLNGKEVEPRAEAIMIAATEKLIGIGGVMGGSETEVDEKTKNIILECATFDMYSIRRTSMEHGLFTDAVTRFTKGQSPRQNLAVLAKIVDGIQNFADGKGASNVIDDKHLSAVSPPVHVTASFINSRLGLGLKANEMKKLLENVEFAVHEDKNILAVTPPFWRTDIEIPEDIVEEIGRLYGFDKLPLELPRRSIEPARKDELLELKDKIRATLAKAGANEVLTYSFVHGNLLDKAGQERKQAFQIANALSPDLQYYRLSLTPSLLDKVHANIKAGHDEFAIFELGKAHIVGQTDDDGLPREDELTALVVAANDKLKKPGAPYYAAKKYLSNLVPAKLAFKPVPEAMQKFDITKPFDMNRTGFVYAGETFLGIIGEFRSAVTRGLKLPKYCAGFELDTVALKTVLAKESPYIPLPRFPKVTQDITLKVSVDLPYQELFDLIQAEIDKNRPADTLSNLAPLGIFQKEGDKKHKQVTLRLTIASYERTLTDIEVAKLLDQAAKAVKTKFSAERA